MVHHGLELADTVTLFRSFRRFNSSRMESKSFPVLCPCTAIYHMHLNLNLNLNLTHIDDVNSRIRQRVAQTGQMDVQRLLVHVLYSLKPPQARVKNNTGGGRGIKLTYGRFKLETLTKGTGGRA